MRLAHVTPSNHLDNHVHDGANDPNSHQTPTNRPVHPPLPPRHRHQQPSQCEEQRRSGYNQCGADVDVVGLELDGPVGMFLMLMSSSLDRNIATADSNAKQDIQHRTAEACGERHDRESKTGNCDVGYKVSKRIADGEDGETEDSVAHVQYDSECFQHSNHLVGNRAYPSNADSKAKVAQECSPTWRAVGCRGGEENCKHRQGKEQRI
jgi:hypothetical protein